MTITIPPHDKQAERAVLGAVLLKNDCIASIQGMLAADDFYLLQHRVAFEGMVALSKNRSPIDPVTIADELRRQGKLKALGELTIFSEILDEVVTTANVEHYAEIVRDFSRRRAMIDVGRSLVDGGYRQSDTGEYLLESRRRVLAVADQYVAHSSPLPIAETIGAVFDEIFSGGEPEGLVKTGIAPIDSEFGGLWPGLLTVCASRPSMGKSCLAVNIAANAALAEKKVLLVSLEDTARFVQFRLLARFGEVPLDRIVNRRLDASERRRLDNNRDIVACLPLRIEDTASMTSEQIRRLAFSQADCDGLDLLIIDHLGHIRERGKDLYEATTAAARTITQIPKELNIPVLLLHQLNRSNLQQKDKLPELGNLRQSGEVEQLARVVWLLHRPAYHEPNTADPSDMQLIVAKNSHGRTGGLQLFCDLEHMYIRERSAL